MDVGWLDVGGWRVGGRGVGRAALPCGVPRRTARLWQRRGRQRRRRESSGSASAATPADPSAGATALLEHCTVKALAESLPRRKPLSAWQAFRNIHCGQRITSTTSAATTTTPLLLLVAILAQARLGERGRTRHHPRPPCRVAEQKRLERRQLRRPRRCRRRTQRVRQRPTVGAAKGELKAAGEVVAARREEAGLHEAAGRVLRVRSEVMYRAWAGTWQVGDPFTQLERLHHHLLWQPAYAVARSHVARGVEVWSGGARVLVAIRPGKPRRSW